MKKDIHRIQATEKALLVSEEKYRALVELASDAIFVADAETGIITDVNRKGLELIGRAAEDIVGLHLVSLHPDDESDFYRKIIGKHYKSPPVNKTLLVMHASGRRIPVEISSTILDYGGRKILQGIFRDITQRMRIDEELQKAERLKSASLLAGGIAHDFNNLLTAILGNISLAQFEARDDASDAEASAGYRGRGQSGAGAHPAVADLRQGRGAGQEDRGPGQDHRGCRPSSSSGVPGCSASSPLPRTCGRPMSMPARSAR